MKMKSWRLLKLETYNAFMNMAIDEAVLKARIEGFVPNTLRFYRWKPSAVSIGRFQKIENEVLLENCKKQGVDVVRRITGGGTVYHDANDEITYSVVANKNDMGATDITSVYMKIYAGLAEALKILGIKADFNQGDAKHCPNLTINGKKISGSAQCHKGDFVLQHGTLLIGVNLQRMFTFLRVPWARTCMEVVEVAKRKITSIKDELAREVSIKEVYQALVDGFQKALKIELVEGDLTERELKLAEKLCEKKYLTETWNFRGESIYEK
ncbi:lipoate--protein ligase family protein [Candidatus Bathyarchaeota archaeon]|nr:lipoate--protein ligase family protein [Candidatus Bathyarchaeota archaeon]